MKEKPKHHFLSEELLVPNVDKVDAGRVTMFCSNIIQSVVPVHGEIPKIFTRFENQIGEVSSAYCRAEEDFTVIKELRRNENNSLIVIQYNEDKSYDVINKMSSFNVTEDYGYSFIDNMEIHDGQEVKKGELLHHSTAYDEHLNLRYGINLKTVYYAFNGQTYEDGIVISETAAKKLAHDVISEITITVNTNDILLNLFGDEDTYQCLPAIGDEISQDILAARRRITNDIMLANMNNSVLKRIMKNDDTFYGDGVIEDIFVYCNKDIDQLKDPHNEQLVEIIKKQREYDELLLSTLEPIIASGCYSDNLSYAYVRSKNSLSPDVKWISERDFDNIVIKIKVKKTKIANIGSKITNRFGGKGGIRPYKW